MDLGLSGKLALVTGSTAGIGFAIARQLAREGATVYVNGRTQARVDHAVREIGAANVKGVAADLSSRAGVDALIAQIPRLDVLVNNFGIFDIKPVLEIPDEEWLRFFESNVLSGIRLVRRYLPDMVAHKWGRVIFISSESAIQIPAEMVHYGLSKTAQVAVARGIAESFPASGVTVNSVLVGPTDSVEDGRRRRVLRDGAPLVAAQALCHDRRVRVDGHVPLQRSGVGDHRFVDPRRRRRHPRDHVVQGPPVVRGSHGRWPRIDLSFASIGSR